MEKLTKFKPLPLPPNKKQCSKSEDERYWDLMETVGVVEESGPVNRVAFSPVDPFHIAVSCSAKVQLYEPSNCQVVRSLSRFRSAAYGGVFRSDGALVAAGSEDGSLRVFQVSDGSRSVLRIYKAHERPVHACAFLCDGNKLCCCSDDGTLKCWDLSSTDSKTPTSVFCGHEDVVRCLVAGHSAPHLFLSGSYDHSVRIWDERCDSARMTLSHGAPVEAVLLFPNDSLVASAGGTVVKIWDLVGGRQLAQVSQHHKTVTNVCFASNYSRLLSGGLDKMIKVYDVKNFHVVHTLSFSEPVLSMDISKDDCFLAVGTVGKGLLSVQRRRVEAVKKAPRLESAGKDVWRPSEDQLLPHDRFLRNFEYSKGLTFITSKGFISRRQPEAVIGMLKELSRRGALARALVGRNKTTLRPVVRFLCRNIGQVRFQKVVLGTVRVLLNVYADCTEPEIIAMLRPLEKAVNRVLDQNRAALQLLGALDLVIGHSSKKESAPHKLLGKPSIQRIVFND